MTPPPPPQKNEVFTFLDELQALKIFWNFLTSSFSKSYGKGVDPPPYGKFHKKNVFFIETFPNSFCLNSNLAQLLSDWRQRNLSCYLVSVTLVSIYKSIICQLVKIQNTLCIL